MFVVGRHEYQQRSRIAFELRRHFETRKSRHLDVEEHGIRFQAFDCGCGRQPVHGFTHDVDIRVRAQPATQLVARRRLVVDDEYPHHALYRSYGRITVADTPSASDASVRLGAIAVYQRQPFTAVAHADAGGLRDIPVAGVVDLNPQIIPLALRLDANRYGLTAAFHTVFVGVLEQRLQQHRRHGRVERVVVDIPFQRHASHEAFLHDGGVELQHLQFFTQRGEMTGATARLARSRSASRASSRSARSTSVCINAEIVFRALKRKCG